MERTGDCAGSARGDSVWLFSLRGKLGPVAAPASAVTALPVLDDPMPDLARGRAVFATACVACHGPDGAGGQNGPSLARMTDSTFIANTVSAGRRQMPSFAATLTPAEIRDVSAHVAQNLRH